MDALLDDQYLWVGVTLAVYYGAVRLQRACGGNLLLNPILLTIAAMVGLLLLTGVGYAGYESAADVIVWWMQPAIVALAWPLHEHWDAIRREALPIIASQMVGAVTGVVSVIWLLRAMGGSDVVTASMVSKSVTMPIAMAVSNKLGGMMSLTSIVVIATGLLGALTGGMLMDRLGVRAASSRGLAIGAASHAVGTASCYAASEELGAYSTIAMIVNGVITSLIAPWLLGVV